MAGNCAYVKLNQSAAELYSAPCSQKYHVICMKEDLGNYWLRSPISVIDTRHDEIQRTRRFYLKKVDSVLLIRYICFPLQHCAVVNMFMNTCATLSQKAVIHPNHLSILRRHAKKNRVIWFAFLTKIKCNGFQTNSGILIIGLKMAFSHSFF